MRTTSSHSACLAWATCIACGGDPIEAGNSVKTGSTSGGTTSVPDESGSSSGQSTEATDPSIWEDIAPCDPATEVTHEGNVRPKTAEDFAALVGVECVSGELAVESYEGSSFPELHSLTRIVGGFVLYRNEALTDLTGLLGLREIGSHVVILENPTLESLEGLHNVRTIYGYLEIGEIPSEFPGEWDGNPVLRNLDGLRGLRAMPGQYPDILVGDNDELIDISGLSGIESVGKLEVIYNDKLPGAAAESLGKAVEADEVIHCANLDDGTCNR